MLEMDARTKAIGIITGGRVQALEDDGLMIVDKQEIDRLKEKLNKAISRLAEYEDIGMTPEEIKSALEDYKDLQKQYEALVCKMLR